MKYSIHNRKPVIQFKLIQGCNNTYMIPSSLTAHLQKIGLILLSILLTACMGGSQDYAVPTTKPRAEIQSDISLQAPVSGERYSRLYAYGDFFFTTVKDQGVQIIDNSNPESPQPINFINIAGAKDLVIDGDTLVTNQYSDLVILSISEKKEVSRINDLYDYKDYLDLPNNTVWKSASVLADHVVVGFTIEKKDDDDDLCLLICF